MYEEIVDALGDLHGVHPGYRAVHAKGVFCRGTFTAAPQARELTRAAHMQGEPVDVLARFSNGSGNPEDAGHLPARGPRPGDELSPPRRRPHRHRRDLDPGVLRPHRRGLPRVRARAKARPRYGRDGHGEGRRVRRRAPRDPGGSRVDPADPGSTRELRGVRVQRPARVRVLQRRRRAAVRALPLGAGRRRQGALGRGDRSERPRVPPGGDRRSTRCRARRLHTAGASRGGRRPARRPDRPVARGTTGGHRSARWS